MAEPGFEPRCVCAERSLLLSTRLYFSLHIVKGKYLTEVTEGARLRPRWGMGSVGLGGLREAHLLLETQLCHLRAGPGERDVPLKR